MINSKEEYHRYLKEDLRHLYRVRPGFIERTVNPIVRYERLLRKCEYLKNTSRLPNPFLNPLYFFSKLRLKHMGLKLGFSISENCFDEGLSIAHYGCIVVNPGSHIGKNCRIHTGVNIGSDAYSDGVPTIGDNCYIGPGAKIFGAITIGDNTVIGANAVVNKSFEGNGTIAGVPAKQISSNSAKEILLRNAGE